jgi:hypothetical protein
MSTRPKIPTKIELDVINLSARRCCMCFSLSADFSEKQGQIAHLDHDKSNNSPGNLAWICLPHHDQYDSKTSQSKGYSEKEVKKYRDNLHEHVERWRCDTVSKDDSNSEAVRKILDENVPLIFFAALATADSVLRSYMLKQITDSVIKEKIIDVWAFLDSPADGHIDRKDTNFDLMVHDISKTGDVGKADLKTLLGLSTEALLRMSEEKRVEALIAIKGSTLREGLMVLLNVGFRMIQESKDKKLG